MSQDTSVQVIEASSPHKEPLYITLLASEWNSLAGGLLTLNRACNSFDQTYKCESFSVGP